MTYTAKTYWRKYYPRQSYMTALRRIKAGNIPSNHKVSRHGHVILIDVIDEVRVKMNLPFNTIIKGKGC